MSAAALTPANTSTVEQPRELEVPRAENLTNVEVARWQQQRGKLGARRELGPGVPANFGAVGGREISNKATLLKDLWKSLGHDRPPAIAYIFVEPMSVVRVEGDSGSGTNPFGHAAVAYTLDGKTTVMNIVGKPGAEMVNFLPLEDYLFCAKSKGSEQGGLYNRSMKILPVWDWPDQKVRALDAFYRGLQQRQARGDAGFFLAAPSVLNGMHALLHRRAKELGNCARWTSLGLQAAGLVDAPTDWPKRIAVDILKGEKKRRPDNVSLVRADVIPHAVQSYGVKAKVNGRVVPWLSLDNLRFRDLGARADAELLVPPGTTTGVARRVTRG